MNENKQISKQNFHQLKLNLSSVFKSRIKDQDELGKTGGAGKTAGKHSNLANELSQIPVIARAPDRFLYYRDVALVRFHDKPTKILNENELSSIFLQGQNKPYWRDVIIVQTNVKSKIGTGKLINIKYFAPITLK